MSRQQHRPGDAADAPDWLDVRKSVACAWCTKQFVPTGRPGGRGHRFCSKRCRMDAENAAKRIGPRAEPLPLPFPLLVDLPPLPWQVTLVGSCVTGGYPPYWTSDNPAERELAKRICRSCSARSACLEWSLHLPTNDNAVYAGLNKNGRRKLRQVRSTA